MSELTDCSVAEAGKPGAEVFLVEGESAAESILARRNNRLQAVLALQGKIRNALTSSTAKVLGDPQCIALIDALGAGTGDDCDPAACRYERILIATDADLDGLHARALLVVFAHTHLRPLLEAGYFWVVRNPLFAITDTNGEIHYGWTDEQRLELTDRVHAAGASVLDVRRFKALGQMEANELERWGVDPATRQQSQLTLAAGEAAVESFARMKAMGGARPLP